MAPTLSAAELARLEGIAFRAWPAAVVETNRGVLLRATGGESRRANSAALHACAPDLSSHVAIDVAETFYRQRGLAVQLQISPCAPAGIDATLAARGYEVAAPVSVQTAPIALGDPPKKAGDVRAEILAAPDARWIEVEVARGRYGDIAETFVPLVRRLPCAGFGVATAGGAVAAAVLAVYDDGVLVLSAMRTLAEMRRRGAARALVAAAMGWGAARGATLAYLQVDRDNAAAIPLYAAFGFVTRYEYHYRVSPADTARPHELVTRPEPLPDPHRER
jgi:ribosomal protein S18 acetylase RimI-like enzyme